MKCDCVAWIALKCCRKSTNTADRVCDDSRKDPVLLEGDVGSEMSQFQGNKGTPRVEVQELLLKR